MKYDQLHGQGLLGSQPLSSQMLVADNVGDCNSAPDAGTFHYVTVPQNVITYLDNAGAYPTTVAGLLALANDALSNYYQYPQGKPSFSQITTALTAVNEGFDNCQFVRPIRANDGTIEDPGSTIEGGNKLVINATIVPNPFISSTMIQFNTNYYVREMTVEVYNMMGMRVAELFRGAVNADELYEVLYTARPIDAQGMYLVLLRAEDGSVVKRMILIK